MNDADARDTYLIDHDPAKLLPYSKGMIDEDPDAVMMPRAYARQANASARCSKATSTARPQRASPKYRS
jgi:hypothetical protein